MFTADYTIRKYLINKLAVIVNLQYPSKASVDNTTMVYIGDSSVPVSYTHLDVYKRQNIICSRQTIQ